MDTPNWKSIGEAADVLWAEAEKLLRKERADRGYYDSIEKKADPFSLKYDSGITRSTSSIGGNQEAIFLQYKALVDRYMIKSREPKPEKREFDSYGSSMINQK